MAAASLADGAALAAAEEDGGARPARVAGDPDDAAAAGVPCDDGRLQAKASAATPATEGQREAASHRRVSADGLSSAPPTRRRSGARR